VICASKIFDETFVSDNLEDTTNIYEPGVLAKKVLNRISKH
jgi:hypothetical protein